MNFLEIDILQPFKDIFQEIINTLPMIAMFVLFVILSWLVIKVFLYVVRKALAKTKIDV